MKTVFSPLHARRTVKTELDGGLLERLDLPTVFTMEGGYDVEAIGVNAVNVMQGFEGKE